MRDTVRLDFFLSTKAVLMSPILVTGTARDWKDRYTEEEMCEVYSRMRRYGASGEAVFILRDSLAAFARRDSLSTSAILNRYAARRGHGCNDRDTIPDIYVNGGPFIAEGIDVDAMFPPGSLQAIEIYTSPQIPGEFGRALFRPDINTATQQVPAR
jgi:hypothetical protein